VCAYVRVCICACVRVHMHVKMSACVCVCVHVCIVFFVRANRRSKATGAAIAEPVTTVTEHSISLQCVAVCCSALQCVAVRCSGLQCVAVSSNSRARDHSD